MKFTVSALAALAIVTPALARPADDSFDLDDIDFSNLECIGKCIATELDPEDTDYMTAKCDGDEYGQPLLDCMCDSVKSADFFPCVKKCPQDEKDNWSKAFKGLCKNGLFGDSSDDDDSSSKPTSTSGSNPSSTTESSSTTDTAEASSTTDTAEASSTTDTAEGTSTTLASNTDESGAEQTGDTTGDEDDEAEASEDDEDDEDAAVRNTPALLAVGGFVAAFLL